MTLALFLSGLELRSNQAVDDLVNQSAILRGNIDLAIQGIGGFITYSPSGQLAPQGVLQAGYITFDNMSAYNDALQAVQNTTFYSAEDYLYDQQQAAQQNMEEAISDFVTATLAVVETIEVNRLAEEAQESGEIRDQEALQNFISEDTYLTEAEVSSYNQAITDIEEYGGQLGAYTAVLSNESYVAEFQSTAETYGESFLDATINFDAVGQALTIQWINMTREFKGHSVDLSQYYLTADEFYSAGQQSEFYTTSPIACGYDFSQCGYDG